MKVIYGSFDTYKMNTVTEEAIANHVYNSILNGVATELPKMVKIQAEPNLDGGVRYTGSIAIGDNLPWNSHPMIDFDTMVRMQRNELSVDEIIKEHARRQQREQEDGFMSAVMSTLAAEDPKYVQTIIEGLVDRYFKEEGNEAKRDS